MNQVFFVVTLAKIGLSAQPVPKGGNVWLTQDIAWEKAPPEYNPDLTSGRATILYLRADGHFGLMYCLINRVRDNLVVSGGDGQVIYEGKWKSRGDEIDIKYRLTYRTVMKIGERFPGPEKSGVIHGIRIEPTQGVAQLEFEKAFFIPAGDRIDALEIDPQYFTFRKTRSSTPRENVKHAPK